jgi:hypothetical protein
VKGHCEFDSKKTCPNIDMLEFRKMLINDRNYGDKTIVEMPAEIVKPKLDFKTIFKSIFSLIKNRGIK